MSVDTWEQGDQPDQADQPPSTVNNDTKNLDLHPHRLKLILFYFSDDFLFIIIA